jgi:hypothetical protein
MLKSVIKQQSILFKLWVVLNPHLRDVLDFQHKLWDQLFIMSDFKLNVESPYPIPSREVLQLKPDVLGYPQNSKIPILW